MNKLLPTDVSWLNKHFSQRNHSSFVTLSSVYGYSESELVSLFSIENNSMFCSTSGDMLLSVHADDAPHSQVRIQLCVNKRVGDEYQVLEAYLNKMNANKLYSYVFPTEVAEIDVLQSLGFIKEVVFREHVFLEGSYIDIIVYGQLRSAV